MAPPNRKRSSVWQGTDSLVLDVSDSSYKELVQLTTEVMVGARFWGRH